MSHKIPLHLLFDSYSDESMIDVINELGGDEIDRAIRETKRSLASLFAETPMESGGDMDDEIRDDETIQKNTLSKKTSHEISTSAGNEFLEKENQEDDNDDQNNIANESLQQINSFTKHGTMVFNTLPFDIIQECNSGNASDSGSTSSSNNSKNNESHNSNKNKNNNNDNNNNNNNEDSSNGSIMNNDSNSPTTSRGSGSNNSSSGTSGYGTSARYDVLDVPKLPGYDSMQVTVDSTVNNKNISMYDSETCSEQTTATTSDVFSISITSKNVKKNENKRKRKNRKKRKHRKNAPRLYDIVGKFAADFPFAKLNPCDVSYLETLVKNDFDKIDIIICCKNSKIKNSNDEENNKFGQFRNNLSRERNKNELKIKIYYYESVMPKVLYLNKRNDSSIQVPCNVDDIIKQYNMSLINAGYRGNVTNVFVSRGIKLF